MKESHQFDLMSASHVSNVISRNEITTTVESSNYQTYSAWILPCCSKDMYRSSTPTSMPDLPVTLSSGAFPSLKAEALLMPVLFCKFRPLQVTTTAAKAEAVASIVIVMMCAIVA